MATKKKLINAWAYLNQNIGYPEYDILHVTNQGVWVGVWETVLGTKRRRDGVFISWKEILNEPHSAQDAPTDKTPRPEETPTEAVSEV